MAPSRGEDSIRASPASSDAIVLTLHRCPQAQQRLATSSGRPSESQSIDVTSSESPHRGQRLSAVLDIWIRTFPGRPARLTHLVVQAMHRHETLPVGPP